VSCTEARRVLYPKGRTKSVTSREGYHAFVTPTGSSGLARWPLITGNNPPLVRQDNYESSTPPLASTQQSGAPNTSHRAFSSSQHTTRFALSMQGAYSRIQTGKAPHVLHCRAISSGRRDLQLKWVRSPWGLYSNDTCLYRFLNDRLQLRPSPYLPLGKNEANLKDLEMALEDMTAGVLGCTVQKRHSTCFNQCVAAKTPPPISGDPEHRNLLTNTMHIRVSNPNAQLNVRYLHKWSKSCT
jgi:hypothetical protein